jgi:hypothetical protein
MTEWTTYTPDGRRVVIRRERGIWIVTCGESSEARSDLLDVALIEAIRQDSDTVARFLGIDYGVWTRKQADRIEGELADDEACGFG